MPWLLGPAVVSARPSPLALAHAGYDLAITARTLVDGDRRLEGDDSIIVPGGLDTTGAGIEAAGGRALSLYMDVLDRATVEAAVHHTVAHFERLDVVVNNAIYQGPGAMLEFMDLTDEQIKKLFEGNLFAHLAVLHAALPTMIAGGGGIVVNIISATAYTTPTNRIGSGWLGNGLRHDQGGLRACGTDA